MKYRQLKAELMAAGCYLYRRGGNHDMWYSPITKRKFPFGTHSGDVPLVLEKRIREESGVKKQID